jgi:hypothetical protein
MNTHRLPHKLAATVVGALTMLLSVGVLAVASPAQAAGSARLVATPRPVAFGPVDVGRSAGVPVTVTNSGTAATAKPLRLQLTGTSFAVTSDACTGHRLPARTSCAIQVSFTPTSAVTYKGTLMVTAGGLSVGPIAVTGTGVAAARLTMTPATQAFGTVGTGQRSDLVAFTVTNSGGAPAGAITTSRPGPDFPVFADTCAGAVLAPKASCSYSVAFAPQSRGAKTGTLTATATPGGTAQAALSGTGLAAAQLGVSGNTAFPDTSAGTQSDPITYTVTNGGDQPSGPITLAAFTSPDFTVTADRCSGQSLTPGASCGIDVRFIPQTYGAKTDVLSVSAQPGGGVNLPLAGTGLGTAHLSISPADFTFPNTAVGSTTFVQVFAVTNDGTGPAWYNDSDTTNYATEQGFPYAFDAFALGFAPEACQPGEQLDPGQSCNLGVSATPQLFDAGGIEDNGNLYVHFSYSPDAHDQDYAQASLHVTGI